MADMHIPGAVVVLTIDHEHGTNLNVHRTRRGAEQSLLRYVDYWWEPSGITSTMPTDAATAIEMYFAANPHEQYTIQEIELGD